MRSETEAAVQTPPGAEAKPSPLERLYAPALRLFGVRYITGDVNEIVDRIVEEMLPLINESSRQIKIIVGDLSRGFFTRPLVLGAIEEAVRVRGVKAKIITGPQPSEEPVRDLRKRGVEIRRMSDRPPFHFTVIDGKHVKSEEPHSPEDSYRRHYVLLNRPDVAKTFDDTFDRLWEELT